MPIPFGRRTLRIKNYTENFHPCPHCRSFDIQVGVWQQYFHVCFIPFFPVGIKHSKLWCRGCGQPLRLDSIQSQYEKKARPPFYLYSGLIGMGLLVLWVAAININTQKEKREFVQHPQAGDVYLIRKDLDDSTIYYFLRISSVNGDLVSVYHSNLMYKGFITKLQSDDYFVKADEWNFTKRELAEMLEKDEINSVERNYESREGFNRIK